MAVVDRVRNICVSPVTEWPVIEMETTQPSELAISYLIPLAAIGAVAGFIGSTLLRAVLPFGPISVGLAAGLVAACLSFVLTIVGLPVVMKAAQDKALVGSRLF